MVNLSNEVKDMAARRSYKEFWEHGDDPKVVLRYRSNTGYGVFFYRACGRRVGLDFDSRQQALQVKAAVEATPLPGRTDDLVYGPWAGGRQA